MAYEEKKAPKREDRRGAACLADEKLGGVTGGTSLRTANPLVGMLDMYYRTAREETDPAAKAEAVRVYNETLEKLTREGVNCAGYRPFQM